MGFRLPHWRFSAEFCTPGEGHEKGGIEGEGGYFRRNHLVPVPSVADLDALNALLLAGCREDEVRILDGRSEPIGAAMVVERDHLTARAPEGFDLADVMFPLVDKHGCVLVKTNAYSVPLRPGSRVEARVYPLHVEVGTPDAGSPDTSAVTGAASMCWIWSTISTCWVTSRVHSRDPNPLPRCARRVAGRLATTSCGIGC